jgi:class 3 adenylate cyclase
MTDTRVPVSTSTTLLGARDALGRHAWQEAHEGFTRAADEGPLGGDDLEQAATAAWFSGQGDLSIEIKERAVEAFTAEGDPVRAAYLAIDIAREYSYKRKPSIAMSWLRRADRLLDGQPETYAHGWLAIARAGGAAESGDGDGAARFLDEAAGIADRTADANLRATVQIAKGDLRIRSGEAPVGMALLEEAASSAAAGELSPFHTGVVFCGVISACRDLTDYGRASEWTEETDKWCRRESIGGFPGICRVHRAEVVAIKGEWDRALSELERATAELAAFNATPPLSDGIYAIGELRYRTGDLAGAEAALREADALGRSPQPALALVRLAEGKTKAAASAIATALDETEDVIVRSRLLPAQVEIAIAAGDLATARAAADEYARLSTNYDVPASRARRHETLGRILLAEGSAAEAARELRAAIRDWREVEAPYDIARDRALLGAASVARDDDDAAELEFQAAHAEFTRLGARLDAAATDRALADIATRRSGPATASRTFMFTDIVGSTKLAEALGDESWERLLAWHDETLRAQVARNGGEVVNGTGDGLFAAFETTRQAVASAIDIQRALAEHRRATGFALAVRIGLHAAEASRRGADYSGTGVNVAARVAAIAEGGQIVVTTASLGAAPEIGTSDVRGVALKGIGEPVEVATVTWL